MFTYLIIGLVTLAMAIVGSMLLCKVDESYRTNWESFTECMPAMVLTFAIAVFLWPFVIALNVFLVFSNKT